jgi:hypothetical protein
MGVGIQIDSAGHEVPVSHGDVSLQGLPLRAIGSAPQKDNLLRTVNILRSNPGAVGNTITTALYTWYTFPTVGVLELIYPWNKFANFYFFLVGLMQMSPASLTNRQPSSWLTLTFICLCELYFKAKEDLARHRADAASNNEVVEVLAAIEESTDLGARDAFEPKAWKHVRVGDVVRVRARERLTRHVRESEGNEVASLPPRPLPLPLRPHALLCNRQMSSPTALSRRHGMHLHLAST